MRGISSSGKDRIKDLVHNLFDKLALKLLGRIPALRNKNIPTFTGLATLGAIFVAALGNRRPNPVEEDALRGMLDSSHGYLDSLKNTTASNVAEQVDGLVRQAHLNGENVSDEDIQEVLEEQLGKAKRSLATIAMSEATKVRNVGSAVDIARISSESGIEDPNVFFIIRPTACKWCVKNHTINGVPKVFKLSQIKHGFLSTAEKVAGECSICGQHPNCECTLSYLAPGYGFKNGKLSYIHQAHDEYKKQNS